MNLVFIYGPPAVGKLTIAKELTKQVGYKNFHNHKAYDLVSSIIDETLPQFPAYVKKVMLEGIEIALEQQVNGLIFTFCYAKGEDDNFVKEIIKKVKKERGKVHFVQLTCKEKELFKRVKQQSRKKFGKIKTKKTLKIVLKKWKLHQKIPFVKSLVIDNSKIKPKITAEIITKYYKL